jgi:pantoate kinase
MFHNHFATYAAFFAVGECFGSSPACVALALMAAMAARHNFAASVVYASNMEVKRKAGTGSIFGIATL